MTAKLSSLEVNGDHTPDDKSRVAAGVDGPAVGPNVDAAGQVADHKQQKVAAAADIDFQHSIEAAAEQLRTTGWAIIDGVLDSAECEGYVEGVWRWLGSLGGGISREDPSSWQKAWPPTFKGIINTLEVAHQDFVWRVRKHPKVLQVFSALYGTNELLSSFDSINVVRPGPNDEEGWLHVDQAPLRRGMYCIQGLVNLVDVGPGTTGTLMVKDRSHLEHAPFFEHHTCLTREQQEKTADFYMFQKEELPYWEAFQSLALSGKAGSLFLWDSRTAHQNVLPKLSEAWRQVCYVCFQPRSLATPEDLALKQQAYRDYRVTTHWPARNVKLFPALGEEYYADSNAATSADASTDAGAEQEGGAGNRISAANGSMADGMHHSTADGAAGAANGDQPAANSGIDVSATDGSLGSSGEKAAESSAADPHQQAREYWGKRFADGSVLNMLVHIRTRDAVEDRLLLQLAGVEEYGAEEVVTTQPLLEVVC